MKNRIFLSLLLSTVLALPGFAQQTNTNSSAQPAASAAQTAPAPQSVDTGREPLKPVTPVDFWDGDEPNIVNLVSHPLTTKKYVQRQVQPIRDRINELDELTTSTSGMIKDVDARAQKGLQLASEKTSLADEHATDATNRAQMAQTAATQAATRVSTDEHVVGNLDQYQANTQTEIRFRPGQSVLSKQAKDALDQMAAPLKDQHSYIIEIRGFASGRGQAAIANSQKMADSVVRYLVLNYQIPVYRIYVQSMGNAPLAAEAGTKHISGGRLEVNVLKNELLSSAH